MICTRKSDYYLNKILSIHIGFLIIGKKLTKKQRLLFVSAREIVQHDYNYRSFSQQDLHECPISITSVNKFSLLGGSF